MFIHSERQAYHDTVQYLYVRPAKGAVKCLKYFGYIRIHILYEVTVYKNHEIIIHCDL